MFSLGGGGGAGGNSLFTGPKSERESDEMCLCGLFFYLLAYYQEKKGKNCPLPRWGREPPLPLQPYKLSPRCIFSHPRKKGKTREGKEGESFRASSLLGRTVAKTVGYFFLAKRDSQIEIGSEPRSIPY